MSETINLPPVDAPKPSRAHRLGTGRVAVASATAVVAGFLGVMVGVSDASTSTTPTAAAPAPTETVEVKVPGPTKTEHVTKTVTKKVTPASCAQAIAAADRVVEAFQWETDWVVRYLTAVGDLDVAKMTTLNGEIRDKTDQYAGIIPAYEMPAQRCRTAK